MKITDAFLGEHGTLYALFDHLEQTVPTAASLVQVQATAPLVAACLMTHARLEDTLLFAALEPYLGTANGPLAVMRQEHDEIERALDQIQEIRNLGEAQRLALQTIQVARDHFAKEEQVLFHLAERMLGPNALAELGEQWAERRGLALV